MQRKGSEEMLAIIVQLGFAAAMMILLIVFAHRAYDADAYAEQVYALDNALTAEALQAQTLGTLRIPYLFVTPYQVQTATGAVLLRAAGQGASVRGQYTTREAIEHPETRGFGRMFTWTRTPTSLAFTSTELARNCPAWPDAGSLSSITIRSDDDRLRSLAHNAVENGAFERVEPSALRQATLEEHTTPADLEIRIIEHEERHIGIAAGSDLGSKRIQCLLVSEINNAALPTALPGPAAGTGLTISVPALDDEQHALLGRLITTSMREALR